MSIETIHAAVSELIAGRGPVRGLAVAPDGSGPTTFPEPLGDLVDQPLELDAALDVLHPDSYGSAIAAYQLVLRTGSTGVRVKDAEGRAVDLCLLDATDEFDCLIGLLLPASAEPVADLAPEALLPRRFGWTVSATGIIETVDANAAARLGWERDHLVGASLRQLIHPDDGDRSLTDWIGLLSEPGSTMRSRRRFATADGRWMWGEATQHNRLHDPEHGDVIVEVLDITEEMVAQEALCEREQLLVKLTQALPAGVLHLDPEGHTELANTRWHELTGQESDALDAFCSVVTEPDDLRASIDESTDSGVDREIEVTIDAGPDHPVEFGLLRIRPLDGRGSARRSVLLVLDDITQERRRRENLTAAAVRDPLTGVLNRAGLEAEIAAVLDEEQPVTVLFCDLDGLKLVNDVYGHATGDEAIRRLANSLTQVVRSGDVVGRLGGDEFVVALPTADEAFVTRVLDEIAQRLQVVSSADGGPPLSCSIGVAHRRTGEDLHALLRRADTEMYEIKELRRTANV